MSFHSVTLTAPEAVAELKSVKGDIKDTMAAVQASPDMKPNVKEAIAARCQRRVDALKVAIVALGGMVSPSA